MDAFVMQQLLSRIMSKMKNIEQEAVTTYC